MKIVIDTNIVLDTIGKRQPFFKQSRNVMQLVAQRKMDGAITANTVTDIAYLLRKHIGQDSIKTALRNLMDMLAVLEVNRSLCLKAFDIPITDYEDALLAACAQHWKADYIVTRNCKDFAGSPVKAMVPKDFLKQFQIFPGK